MFITDCVDMLLTQIANGVNITTLVSGSTISQLRLTLNYLPLNAVPHVLIAVNVYTDLGLNMTGKPIIDFDPATMAGIEFVDRTVV